MMDSDTIERYDRQIRLWGQHGQTKCSTAKVCLVNADSLGFEILKGLCLAGIGSITILDSHKFTSEDIGSTFIYQFRVGKFRGDAAKSMILDINHDIQCEVHTIETHLPLNLANNQHIDDQESIEDDFKTNVQFWKQFNCVIASGNLHMSQINRLSDVCWSNSIPLIQSKSIGFYGCMINQLNGHIVNDTHPEWLPPNADPDKVETLKITTRQIYEDYKSMLSDIDGEDSENESITEYLCLQALNLFFTTYGRLPGYSDDQVETDIIKLKDCVKKMTGKSSQRLKTLDQCLYELCRYGGAELHVTSAFMGGCVAQEAIKVVTNQYVPVEDSLVYNAMTATTRSFKFNDIFSRLH